MDLKKIPQNIFDHPSIIALIQFGSRIKVSEFKSKNDLDFAVLLTGQPTLKKMLLVKDDFEKTCKIFHDKVPIYHGPIVIFQNEPLLMNILLFNQIMSSNFYLIKSRKKLFDSFRIIQEKKFIINKISYYQGILIEHFYDMRMSIFSHPFYSRISDSFNNFIYHFNVISKLLLLLNGQEYSFSLRDNFIKLCKTFPTPEKVYINKKYILTDFLLEVENRIILHIYLVSIYRIILSKYK